MSGVLWYNEGVRKSETALVLRAPRAASDRHSKGTTAMATTDCTSNQTTVEEWRDIPGYEGLYQVSSFGHVRRLFTQRQHKALGLITPKAHQQGYIEYRLSKKGAKRKCVLAHRLVMAAFVGPAQDGQQVNHIDGDKANNHLSNLEYISARKNTAHAIQSLGRMSGHNQNALTPGDVIAIRRASENGAKAIDLAVEYGVGLRHIYSIRSGKLWAHVHDDAA